MTRLFAKVALVVSITAPALGQTQARPRAAIAACLPAASASASPAHRPPYQSSTWYEFMLRELNPHGTDWGAWYERRRQALLDASLRNPYFWHSFWVSMAVMVLTTALVKCGYDRRREKRIMGEQMDEVRAHDLRSCQVAQDAIRQYNEHLELCNRAIEASGSGQIGTMGGNSELAAELDKAKQQIVGLEGDRRRLEAEVAQRTTLITDLSLRIDALASQAGGNGQAARDPASASHADLVRHINTLQQELYAERERNKRLKGA